MFLVKRERTAKRTGGKKGGVREEVDRGKVEVVYNKS